MKHKKIYEMLNQYHDGELANEQIPVVEGHLKDCPSCREMLAEWRAVSNEIKLIESYNLPVGFSQRVVRSVRAQQKESDVWLPVALSARRWVGALSMIVVLLFAISFISEPEQPIIMESYLAGDVNDSAYGSLLQKETVSKDDILLAAVTK